MADMENSRFKLGRWAQDNWLEIVLVLVLLLAILWIYRTARALVVLPAATTAATATATVPGAVVNPTPAPTSAPVSAVSASTFDGRRAQGYVASQVAFGPRPAGSAAAAGTAAFIAQELQTLGWSVVEQPFERNGSALRNVIAEAGTGPLIVLATHFDTRPTADREADPERQRLAPLGANDGASGVAVLLELARALDRELLENRVQLAFLDGEAAADPRTWSFGSGAAALAASFPEPPRAVVVLNMVGGQDLQLFYEGTSDGALRDTLWTIAEQLGFGDTFQRQETFALADTPSFASLGNPVVNILDLNYPYYHTMDDTPSQINPDSLERVGRVLEVFLEERGTP